MFPASCDILVIKRKVMADDPFVVSPRTNNLKVVVFLQTGLQELELSDRDVEIDLSGNRMREAHFPPSLKRVSRITLAGNEIRATKNVEISALESLKELDLSGNKKLEKLEKDFGSDGLEVLLISGCSVNEIEEGFLQRIPALKSLDLSCNALTELTSLFPSRPRSLNGSGDSWRAHQLTRLNVSHNEIDMMHEKGLIGTRIKVLDVSHNNVAHFRFTLYLQHLVELYASNNKLKNLEGMTLPNANLLDVSKNELRDLRVDFAKRAPKLKTLNLSHNPITRIPKISSYSITDLDLSYCSVSTVEPEAFSNLEGLQRLNLAGNELSSLRHELLLGADNLRFLLLAGNPWKCDCGSEEFLALHRLVLVERAYTDGEDLQCHDDGVFPWSEACRGGVRNDDLYLSSRTAFYAVIYLFSALFGLLAAIFCYRCLRNLKQSDAVIFRNDEAEVNDREDILVDSR